MPAFADSVSALLDTYDNCLSLLRSFTRRRPKVPPISSSTPPHDGIVHLRGGAHNGAVLTTATAAAARSQSRLRRAIRSDRALVERAYQSRLSLSGSLLENGDARARSSLRRILRRLSSAVTRVVRTATGAPDPSIDYNSLASLSNASRVDAIKAIDQLSRRLSTGPPATNPKPPQGKLTTDPHGGAKKKRRKSNSFLKSTAGSSGDRRNSAGNNSSNPQSEKRHDRKASHSLRQSKAIANARESLPRDHRAADEHRTRLSHPAQEEKPAPPAPGPAARSPDIPRSPRSPRTPRSPTPTSQKSAKRISMASFSSDSTKLGEIAARRRPPIDGVTIREEEAYEYDLHTVYPLRPHTQPLQPKRKGFFSSMFSRNRE